MLIKHLFKFLIKPASAVYDICRGQFNYFLIGAFIIEVSSIKPSEIKLMIMVKSYPTCEEVFVV